MEQTICRFAALASRNGILPIIAALSICLTGVASVHAQTLDTLTFGNPTSESNHGFATSFSSTVTPATIVSAGGGTTPSNPSSTGQSVDVAGALGQTGTQLLPRTPNADVYGGQMSFTMTVDPVQQNYLTVKFWGSETATNEWLILDCNGYEVGARHIDGFTGNSEGEQLWHYNTGWYPNRWVYRTLPLPLNLTQGQSSVTLTIRSMGWLAFYDSAAFFGGYAKLMSSPSPVIYEAVTHTNSYFDSSAEVQGNPPMAVTPLTTPTASTAITTIESTVNSKAAGYLNAAPSSLTPDTVDYLAQTYGTSWSTYKGSSAIVTQVIAGIDALTTAYAAAPTTYMGSFGDPSWGGYFGPVGDAIMRLWPQINNGTTMSATVSYGGSLGTVSRTVAWSTALRASIDWGRFNRQTYSNQAVTNAQDIYLANRGLELVQSSNALNESEALRYLYEASGISPWTGNDLPGGGPVPVYGTSQFGPNWYDFTTAGLSKELGFVGSDYGEQGPMIYRMGVIAGDASLKAQGLKLYQARAYFRYTGADTNGYTMMMAPEPIGLRNDWEMPGHTVYLGHYSADDFLAASQGASAIGSNLLGYFQQGINDGQAWPAAESVLYGNVGNNNTQLPLLPDLWTTASSQPQTGALLPQTNGVGLPDFAWADPQNMVISAKHGSVGSEENFYANLNWRDPAYINGMAKIFDLTPYQARDVEVQMQDEQFVSTGITLRGSNVTDDLHEPWDNPTMATSGLPFMEAIRSDLTTPPSQNLDGGRGTGYTMRWGHWLVGMNAYQASTGTTYAMKMPSDFTSGTDLISGQTFNGQVTLQPQTAVVFYMSGSVDPCPVPAFPLNVSYAANNTSATLNWSAAAGAVSYNLSRSMTPNGAFTVIASGIAATTYTDNIAINASSAPYYVVTATNACGTSANSGAIGPVQSTQLPGVFTNQDIGVVNLAGSSTYANGVFTVSGGGSVIGSTADSFQYAYSLVSSDGDYITRVINTQAAQAGLMIRASLTTNAAMAVVMFDKSMGLARFAERATTGAGAVYTNGSTSTAPLWLRLNKSGATVTAYSSVDGITWSLIGSASVTYGTQYYVGFAVTSRNQIPATAQFDSFLGVSTPANSLPTTMTDLDIGSVGTAGLTTYVNGLYDGFGAGTGIGSTVDSFHFNYAAITTDGDYIAQVLNQDAVQEGIMVRASLAPNSAMATALLSGAHATFLGRAATGGTVVTTQGLAVASNPVWLRLNKSGSVLTGYSSTDGINWTQISSTTISFGSTFYVGFGVSSEGTGTQSGLFSGLAGVPAPLNLQVTPLSSNYLDPMTVVVTPVNTQNVMPTGAVSIYDWGDLLATVPLASGTASWSVSPSLLAGVHDLQAVYSGDTVYPQETSPIVAATVSLAAGQSGPCPLPIAPLNLSYTANNTSVFLNWGAVDDTLTYNVSRSLTSGSGFTVVGSGITSTSFTDAFAATTPANAPYYIVTATNACGTGPASAQIGPVQSTQLPSNVSNQDVGTVQTAGTSTYTNGVFTVTGSGSVIGATADSFQYAYSLVSSDGDYITRVTSGQANQQGLMIRASLATNSAMAIVMFDKGMGLARFAQRGATGGTAVYTNGATATAPLWLRLNKSGATVTGYSSVDGINWTKIASASVTYGTQFYVGFAVTNRSATLASAKFDSYMGVPTTVNQLPTTLTSLDIGAVSTAGSATYVNGTYDIFGSGSVIGSTADSFQFTYATMSTDGDYIAQVLNQDAVMEGLMIRSSLNANSAMAVVMLNTALARFAGRPNAGNTAVFTNGQAVTTNPIWLRLNKTGTLVTGYASLDKVTWTQIASTTINSFGSQFYVGFAVTSRASNTQAGMFNSLSGVPAPLTLQLSSSSMPYSSPETLTVTPTNTQSIVPTGTVALYDSGTLLTTLTLANGTASWSVTPSLAVDTHSLTAVYSGDTVYPQETSAVQTLIVTQATALIALSNLTQAYTGSALSPTVSTTPSGVSVSLTYNGSSTAPVAIGSYTVVGTVTNSNYTGSITGTFTITQGTATVALGNLSQTYTGSPLSATVSTTPTGLATSLTYNGSATAPTAAGTYAVVATVNDSNYTGTASGTLVISKATSSVTWPAPAAISYGTTLSATQLNATSPVAGSFTYVPAAGAVLGAGSQTLSVTFAPTDTTDYTAATSSVTLTVNPLGASVTPNASSKVYGQFDPAFTGTLSGFLASDNVTATYSRTPGETVSGSPYVISATVSPSGVLANYNIAYNTAAFTIMPAAASVTIANLAQTYSALPEPVSVTTSPSGLAVAVSYSGISGTVYGPSAVAPTNPGTYSVTATVIDPNSTGSQTGTLTINQADPTVSLFLMAGMPTSTPYGTTAYFNLTTASTPVCPTGTVQFSVDGSPSGSPAILSGTTCNQPVPFSIATLSAGTHSISASYSGDTYFLAENAPPISYIVTPNTTTVTLASSGSSVNVGQPVTYTATVVLGTVDNAAAPSGSIVFYDGATQLATVALNANTASFTTSSFTAGMHSVTAVFVDSDGNFAGSSSAVSTETVNLIAPVLNWTPSTTNLIYGTALDATMLNASAVDTSGIPIQGTFAYNFSVGQVPSAGTVNITASFTPNDSATYATNTTTVTFTVTPATLTVTANNLSTIYGSLPSGFPYTLSGFVNGESAAVVTGTATCSTTAIPSSPVGSYPITCTAGTLASGNYTVTFVNGTLSVTQASSSIAWPTPTAITYGTALSATQLNATSTVPGNFAYSPAAGSVLAAGAQTLSVVLSPTDSTDYAGAKQIVTLTVNKASVAVTLSASPTPPSQGTTEHLTATVSGAGQPGGNVVFTSGATTLCSSSLNASGVAGCSFVPASSGSLAITASYQGDANHLANSASTTLSVYDPSVTLQLSSTQLTYPGAANVTVCVTSATSSTATGTVQVYDGLTMLTTQSLQGGGCAYWYISPGLTAGTHSLTAVYSGDRNNPAGTSVPVTVTVSAVPVTLSASCWNASFSYGGSYICTVSLSSNAGSVQGALSYAVDAGTPNSIPINNGSAQFSVTTPNAGNHSVAISYAAQSNFAAAGPVTESFTVTQAPTQIQLTPSSYYQSASAPLTLTASLTSWSAGAPKDGTVAFYDGTTSLGTLPAGATVTLTSSSLSPGSHALTAVYATGPSGNYAPVTSSAANVQLH